MCTKTNVKIRLTGLLLIFCMLASAQKITIYKINDLIKRIHNTSDTTYVVNFWATWCKPCVAELPEFEKLNTNYKAQKVKVILVSMDFKEDIDKRVKPFLKKNQYKTEVVLLDEINGNDFINQIYTDWSGSIPATLITKKNKSYSEFFEKKLTYDMLVDMLK